MPNTFRQLGLRLIGLMILDAFASLLIAQLYGDGYWQFASALTFITICINIIFLREKAYPLRWMSPGLALMLLISVYPILFTIYIAFTNFGTGHLLPKVQTIEVLESRQFLPEEGITLNYTAFKTTDAGENSRYALWLQDDSGAGFFAPARSAGDEGVVDLPAIGALDEEGVPLTVDGYERLDKVGLVRSITDMQDLRFGDPPNEVQLTAQLGKASALQPRYTYTAADDTVFDHKSETLYRADPNVGSFISDAGETLVPGYQVTIGARNFMRFLDNRSFRGPLLRVFIWTFAFAFFSVFFAFSLGLLIAIAFGRDMPGQKIIKSLLIIPMAIPSVITVLVWKGLLNPLNGVISTNLAAFFGQPVGWPPIFADPWWAKAALLLINVWLAYPYFMLVNSGALQAIPEDIFEAAKIDGATRWEQFRNLTLPLLLVGVGPLLIASFTANFNSINVVYLFNDGGPAMVGTSTPAGHTDILISYVYRLAFAAGGGQDFGYASAITIIIFVVLVVVTLIQYRYMKVWEEVGENV